MKFKIEFSKAYKKSYKRAEKRGLDMNKLDDVVKSRTEEIFLRFTKTIV